MNRTELAKQVESLGMEANKLREALLAVNYVFAAGIVRLAEEGLLIVYNRLKDNMIPEMEL